MRLNKFLARTGIGSRRQCDEYIKNNLIKINGKVETDFSYQVSSSDSVRYNNKILNYVEEDHLYILNKPINSICTSSDQYGRKKVLDLIPSKVRLFTVGRLDYKTTGIILLTNNGDLRDHYKEKVNLQSLPYLNTEYLGFLMDNDPLPLEIRQAINYGFDRVKMLKYLRNNIGTPAENGFIPIRLPAFN